MHLRLLWETTAVVGRTQPACVEFQLWRCGEWPGLTIEGVVHQCFLLITGVSGWLMRCLRTLVGVVKQAPSIAITFWSRCLLNAWVSLGVLIVVKKGAVTFYFEFPGRSQLTR